jgi:hypothetical protein
MIDLLLIDLLRFRGHTANQDRYALRARSRKVHQGPNNALWPARTSWLGLFGPLTPSGVSRKESRAE